MIQTRNFSGRLNYYNSVAEAYEAYKKDKTIFKISFNGRRYIPKTKQDLWEDDSEKILCLYDTYKCADNLDLFWIDQTITGKIENVYTVDEFLKLELLQK